MMNGQLDRLKSFINSESKDNKSRIIGFLSGIDENGKSFCLYNHALSLLKIKKILIVDLLRSEFNFISSANLNINSKIKNELYHIQSINERISIIFVDESDLNNPYILKNIIKKAQSEEKYDIIFLNSKAGSYDNLVSISMTADELVIVCSPDPVSIMDAYASIKIMLRKGIDKKIKIVINKVRDDGEFFEASENLKKAVLHFLKYELNYFCMVPFLNDNKNGFIELNPNIFLLEDRATESESLLVNNL